MRNEYTWVLDDALMFARLGSNQFANIRKRPKFKYPSRIVKFKLGLGTDPPVDGVLVVHSYLDVELTDSDVHELVTHLDRADFKLKDTDLFNINIESVE